MHFKLNAYYLENAITVLSNQVNMGNCRSKNFRKLSFKRPNLSLSLKKRRNNSSKSPPLLPIVADNLMKQIFKNGGYIVVTGCQISSLVEFPLEIMCSSTADGLHFSVVVDIDQELVTLKEVHFKVHHAVWCIENGLPFVEHYNDYACPQAVRLNRPFTVQLMYDLLSQNLNCLVEGNEVFTTKIPIDSGIDAVTVIGEVREVKRSVTSWVTGQLRYEIQCEKIK